MPHLIATLLVLSVLVWAETLTATDLSKISEPPMDTPAGQKHDGVQIGLWTEKPVYQGSEIRNLWMLARKNSDSAIAIGVGGSLFKDSFLYITSNDKEVAKIPLRGPLVAR